MKLILTLGLLAASGYAFRPLGHVYRSVDQHFARSASNWSESDLQDALDLIDSQYQCQDQTTEKLQNKCEAQKQKAINRAVAADTKAKNKYEAAVAKAAAKAAKEAAKAEAKAAKEAAKAAAAAAKEAAKEAAAAAKAQAKAEKEAAKEAAAEAKAQAKAEAAAAKAAAKEAAAAAKAAAKEAAQAAKDLAKEQKATNRYKLNDGDVCSKTGVAWTNDGHVDDWTLANGQAVQSYDGVLSITKPEDASNAAGYFLVKETNGGNVLEVHVDDHETDMVSASAFNRVTGLSNWCSADEAGSGSGDSEDDALVMVFNGEITVEAGNNPESFEFYYCYDPTAVQDC